MGPGLGRLAFVCRRGPGFLVSSAQQQSYPLKCLFASSGSKLLQLPLSSTASCKLCHTNVSNYTTSTTPSHLYSFHPNFPEEHQLSFLQSFLVLEEVVTEDEEATFMKEMEPHLKRHIYEKDHWDDAIVGFRETERKIFNASNTPLVERIKQLGFPTSGKESRTLPYAHVLDLADWGHIKPHIDSSRRMEVSYALSPSGEPPPCKRALTRALEDWDIVTAETVLGDAQYQTWIGEHGWELVGLIAGYLTPHSEEAGPHLTACCQALLTSLASQVTSAKEVLMALLEQLDQFTSSLAVTRLLPALGITLLRIKERTMAHSWAWALSTLRCHLRTVSVPANSGLEGAERLVIDLGPESREAAHLAAASCDLLQPLVEFVCEQDGKGEGGNERRKVVLIRFLVNLLGCPLSILSQHPEVSKEGVDVHPATWVTMEKACKFLSSLTSNMVNLIVEEEKDEEVEPTGLPTMYYWLLGECQQKDEIPQVYSHLHLLHLSSPHICLLLRQTEEMRVHKGLILLLRRLEALPPSSLPAEEAENPVVTSLVEPLSKVIVHHDSKELRQMGFSCYRGLLSAFSLEGRYAYFLFLLNKITHSGLLGWTVTQVKEAVSASLNPATSCTLYHGPGLVRLANKIFALEQGPETDLLEASHHILDTINFSVFLLTRDKENITGGKTLLMPQMRDWTEKLTKGLDLSVAHYKQRLLQPEEETGPEVQAQVGGVVMPKMDKKQRERVLKDALNTFDLIQFNLVRLRDLLDL